MARVELSPRLSCLLNISFSTHWRSNSMAWSWLLGPFSTLSSLSSYGKLFNCSSVIPGTHGVLSGPPCLRPSRLPFLLTDRKSSGTDLFGWLGSALAPTSSYLRISLLSFTNLAELTSVQSFSLRPHQYLTLERLAFLSFSSFLFSDSKILSPFGRKSTFYIIMNSSQIWFMAKLYALIPSGS